MEEPLTSSIQMWLSSPVGLTAVALAVSVVGAVVALFRLQVAKRRQRAAVWVGTTAVQVRRLIEQDVEQGHWQAMVDDYSQAVDRAVRAHHARIDSRLNDVIDGDFFIAAVKGSLADIPAIGRAQWREEFEAMASARFAGLLELDTLQSELGGLMHHAGHQLSARWTPSTLGPSSDLGAVSPDQLRELIGLPPDLGNSFIRESIFDAAALGATILGALSLGTGVNIVGNVLAVLNNSWFQEFVAELVFDYVIEEIGEEVIEELAESIVALFTGIGLVYTLYKVGKYSWKFKKLFIDKEPLQKVRAQVRGVLRERFAELAVTLSEQTGKSMTMQRDQLLGETIELEAHCSQLAPGLVCS